MLIEILYFLAIVLCPFIYFYLSKYFDKALINTKHLNSIKRFHNYIFVILQIWFTLLTTDFLIGGKYILELLFGIVLVYLLYRIFNTKICQLYKSIQFEYIYVQIFCVVIFPIFLMNIIRNYFDTYTIGFLIFNLSNIGIILWEIIILSLLNLGYLFVSVYKSTVPLILIIAIRYILGLIF